MSKQSSQFWTIGITSVLRRYYVGAHRTLQKADVNRWVLGCKDRPKPKGILTMFPQINPALFQKRSAPPNLSKTSIFWDEQMITQADLWPV